jgi:hypothetical protein
MFNWFILNGANQTHVICRIKLPVTPPPAAIKPLVESAHECTISKEQAVEAYVDWPALLMGQTSIDSCPPMVLLVAADSALGGSGPGILSLMVRPKNGR